MVFNALKDFLDFSLYISEEEEYNDNTERGGDWMGIIRDRLRSNIELVIESSDMSKKQIAQELGVTQASISNWIKGKNSPDLETLIHLCELFDVSLDDVYGATPIRVDKDIHQEELLANFKKLNLTGKMKLVDFSDDLVKCGKYTIFNAE